METINFQGTPCHTYGTVPTVGSVAPSFDLTGGNLADVKLSDYDGKRVVLNIFPSLDTEVCARSVRRFNEEASSMPDTVVVCVSMDLPFAMSRFCTTHNIENVTVASAFRAPEFLQNYGVQIVDGPLKGLLARCVLVLDKDHKVIFRDLVHEITDEPDYKAALNVLK